MPAEDIHTTPSPEAAGTEPVEPSRTHLRPVPDPGADTETAAQGSRVQTDSTETATDEDDDTADEAATAASTPWLDAVTWTRTTFSPQSGMWSTRPLAPDEVIDRAKNGSQLPATGPLRTVSIGYGWAAAVGSVVLIAVDWALFKHAARAAVFSVIVTGLLVYPPTRLAIGYALLPLAWAHDLLT